MSKALTISAKDLPAETKARVDTVLMLNKATEQAEADYMLNAYLCGVELLAIKASIDHGDFMDFREQVMPEVSKSKAGRFMQFAELIQFKFPTVGNLKLLPDSPTPERDLVKLSKALESASEGRSMSKLLRDLAEERDRKKRKPKKTTAKEQAEAEKKHAEELAQSWQGMSSALVADVLPLLGDELLKEILDQGVSLTTTIRKMIKK